MNTWRTWWTAVIVLGGMWWGSFVFAQQAARTHTTVEILEIGHRSLAGSSNVILDESTFDIVGRAPAQEASGMFHALARPRGDKAWTVVASARPAPGDVFRLSGLSFPTAGQYELTVGYFDQTLDSASAYADPNLEELSRGLSQRVTLTIDVAPHGPVPAAAWPNSKESFPVIAIVALGGRNVSPPGPQVVELPTDVVVRSEAFPKIPELYLAVLAPHTDRVWIYGPASPRHSQNEYVVPALSFSVPGDFQQTRFELIAFSTRRPITPGPTDVHRFRAMVEYSSAPLVIIADDLTTKPDNPRIANVSITRIGNYEISAGKGEAGGQNPVQRNGPVPPITVKSGDSVEVGDYRNIPEGARIWILTRPRGSPLWLVEGIALPTSPGGLQAFHFAPSEKRAAQGSGPVRRQAVSPAEIAPIPKLVLAAAQFKRQSTERHGGNKSEHEVLAVVALDTLPQTWLASSFLAASNIASVSELVRVKVDTESLDGPENLKVAITRIGQNRVSAALNREPYLLFPGENIEVNLRGKKLPASLHVYVATRGATSNNWQLHDVLGARHTYVAPDIVFENNGANGNAAFEIVAIATEGALPPSDRQLATQQLRERALAISSIVLTSKESGEAQTTQASFGKSISRGMDMWATLLLLAIVMGLVVLTIWIARRFPQLARRGAERVSNWLDRYDDIVKPHDQIDSAEVAVGAIVLGILLYAILDIYLPLFSDTISETLDFSPQRGYGLAVLIVLSTAFTGVLMHLAIRNSETARFIVVGFLLVGGSALIFFQATLFWRVMPSDFSAWWAFALIPFIEATGIYFATKFLWNFLGFAIYLSLRIPLLLLFLLLMSSETIARGEKEPRGPSEGPVNE